MNLIIKKLNVDNIKNITVKDLMLDEKYNIVTGNNGAGKTSLLDAIFFGLGGKKFIKDTKEVIKTGATEAAITVTMKDRDTKYIYKITRKIKDTGSVTLKIVTLDEEGKITKNKLAQTDLLRLLKNVTIDPLELARMSAKEQLTIFKEATGIDTTEIESQIEDACDDRKMAKKNRDAQQSIVDGIEHELDEHEFAEPVNVSDLYQQKDDVLEFNRQQREKESKKEVLKNQKSTVENEIVRLKKIVDDYKKQLKGINAELDNFDAPEELKSIDEIENQIKNSERINAVAAKFREHKREQEKLEEYREEADKQESKVEELRQNRQDIILEAKKSLGSKIDLDIEKGILYEGLTLRQINTAQQINIGVSLLSLIEPEIKIIRISDGSLLDQNTLKELIKNKVLSKYQLFIERVGEEKDGPNYIMMKEG